MNCVVEIEENNNNACKFCKIECQNDICKQSTKKECVLYQNCAKYVTK